MRLYQFMKAEHGLSAHHNRRLKVSRIHELNDPFEFIGVDLADPHFRKALLRTRQQISKTRGLLCFSKRWKSPVLWAHYANNHTGLCLGFDLASRFAKEVAYVKERIPKPRVLDEEFMKQILFSKFEHWSYEHEYRCYVTLDDEIDNLYYADFNSDLRLREVAVGFRAKVTRKQIRDALTGYDESVSSFKVRPAFRTFEMCVQKNPSLWA
jgi:hypothetical protein